VRRYVLFSIGLLSMVLFVELGIIGKSGPMPIDTTVALWFKAHRTAGEIRWAEVSYLESLSSYYFSLITGLALGTFKISCH
jgi:hypothetical protein